MNIEPHKETTMDANAKTTKRDLERLDENIRRWGRQGERTARGGDRELAKQYEVDVEDLKAFRDAVAAGDFDDARCLADNMDTIVRDEIPARLYNAVCR